MVKKSIYFFASLTFGLSSQLLTLANTVNIEETRDNASEKSKIHSLPLNPTFQFSIEELSKGEKDSLNVLLPLPEQDPKEVSKLVKSRRDPFVEQIKNQSNYAIKIINEIKLSGLFKSNGNIFAIITKKDGREYSYKPGQLIAKGIKLTEISIEKQFIEFTHEKETYRIKI